MTDQKHELEELRREVSLLRTDVSDLVAAWKTAQGVVRFVKFLGALATAVTAIWALVEIGKR